MFDEKDLFELIKVQLKLIPGYEHVEYVINNYADLDFYLAGGVVRDSINGIRNQKKDIDIFIGGDNYRLAIEYLKTKGKIEYGPFGSPRWFPSRSEYIYYDIIPIINFYNGLWKCFDIIDVLNQFDFTANALALNMRNSEFYNPQNGLRDIHEGVIRSIRFDYPDEYISEDNRISRLSVLWIRFLHYSTTLNYTIEPITLEWIKINSYRINDLQMFCDVFFIPDIKNNKYYNEIFR